MTDPPNNSQLPTSTYYCYRSSLFLVSEHQTKYPALSLSRVWQNSSRVSAARPVRWLNYLPRTQLANFGICLGHHPTATTLPPLSLLCNDGGWGKQDNQTRPTCCAV